MVLIQVICKNNYIVQNKYMEPNKQTKKSYLFDCIKGICINKQTDSEPQQNREQSSAQRQRQYKTNNNSEGTYRAPELHFNYPKFQILSYKKGLENIGNTCYMNSALQCLLKSKHFISQLPPTRTNQLPKLTDLFCSLVNQMNQEKKPREQLRAIKKVVAQTNPIFEQNGQNDAVEFMSTFLCIVAQELNQPVKSNQHSEKIDHYNFKNVSDVFDQTKAKDQRICKSIVEDTFTGRYMVYYQCLESSCGSVYLLFQKFNVHYVEIPTQVPSKKQAASTHLSCKLADCFESFLKPDKLTGENKISCERCNGETQSLKTMKIYEVNKILTVVLKRFNDGFKNQTRVTIPKTLQLTDILTTVSNQNKYYKLYAAILHFGTLKSGHYIAVCLNQKENCWFEYNDSKVSKLKQFPDLSNAYAVFYQLQSKQQEKNQKTNGISLLMKGEGKGLANKKKK